MPVSSPARPMSRTGSGKKAGKPGADPACSKAASSWLALRYGKPTSMPREQIFTTLARCRGHKRTAAGVVAARIKGKEGVAQHLEHRIKSGQPQSARERALAATEKLRLRSRENARRSLPAQPVNVDKLKSAGLAANVTRPRRFASEPAKAEFYGKHRQQRFAKRFGSQQETSASGREKPKATRAEMQEARREGKGKEARIVLADGKPAPAHIKPSMVPPQWKEVKVSLDPKADLLVTARDAAGRTKAVYSDAFHMKNAAQKFERVHEMVAKHNELVKELQAKRRDPKTKEEADCAWLMQVQATRPGSEADRKAKVKAYGATTLRAEHVVETDEGVRLQFVGKEGVYHDHLIRNSGLAKMLLDRRNTADQRKGKLFDTTDGKVRDFVATLDGGKFSPKDFRTSAATRLAIAEVKADPDRSKSLKAHKKRVMKVAEKVSKLLGNRPQQALESYISPTVFEQWRPD